MRNDFRMRPWVRGGLAVGVAAFLLGLAVVRTRAWMYGSLLVFYLSIHTLIVMNWARMSGYPDARMPRLVGWVFLAELGALALGAVAGLLGAPWQVLGGAILVMAGMPFIVVGSIDIIDWLRRR